MTKHYIQNCILAVALFSAALTPSQAAFLEGQTVRVDYLFPNVASGQANAQAVVGAGVEFSNAFAGTFGVNTFDINVFDTGLSIVFLNNLTINADPFNGLRLSDILSAFSAFNTVTVNGTTTVAGFGASLVSFDTDNIFVNLAGLSPLVGNQLVLDINASGGSSPSPVPEPSTVAGVLSAMLVAALARRCS